MDIDARSVSFAMSDTDILTSADLRVRSGCLMGVVGRNGSGKTTLLRCIYRQLTPTAGVVLIGDEDVRAISARESARRIAVVQQTHGLEFDFTVRDLVLMGRGPHLGFLGRISAADKEIVDGALDATGIAGLGDRIFTTLSGGERQRVYLARALAQQSPVLVLDEPTNHLDLQGQFDLLELVRGLGRTAVMTIHDLSLAARYCDELVVLDAGRVVAAGPPRSTLTPNLIARAFGVEGEWVPHGPRGELLTLRPMAPEGLNRAR